MRNQERQRIFEEESSVAPSRGCDHAGCLETGEYRAPKSRDRLNDYLWFCLDHVREYNKAWNYYAGMDVEEVEHETRLDSTWHRPTWPLGERSGGASRFARPHPAPHDGFDWFDGHRPDAAAREAADPAGRKRHTAAETKAIAVMGLRPPLTLTRLKAKYKQLVKIHHPDANGGDKAAEGRLREIIEAYATLKKTMTD